MLSLEFSFHSNIDKVLSLEFWIVHVGCKFIKCELAVFVLIEPLPELAALIEVCGRLHDAARFFERDVAVAVEVVTLEDGGLRELGGRDLAILIGIVFLEGEIRRCLSGCSGDKEQEEGGFHVWQAEPTGRGVVASVRDAERDVI